MNRMIVYCEYLVVRQICGICELGYCFSEICSGLCMFQGLENSQRQGTSIGVVYEQKQCSVKPSCCLHLFHWPITHALNHREKGNLALVISKLGIFEYFQIALMHLFRLLWKSSSNDTNSLST